MKKKCDSPRLDRTSLPTVADVPQLVQREIQAPLAAALIREYADHIGFDQALSIASQAVQKEARKIGATMARQYGDTIDGLFRIVNEVWSRGGAIEVELLEKTDTALSFNVLRCGYVALYDKLGLRAFGFCLSCVRDASFTIGFNPAIRFERSRTIMEGAPLCDFRFTLHRPPRP